MDQLIKEGLYFFKTGADQTNVLTLWETVFALSMSLTCSVVIGWVYRFTHRGMGYSQSYVQALILTSLVTTVIMMVIGSNIARAFSLVGALSIIRFRNAIKETRDVAFIFFAMAIAMANGTRFPAVAAVATGFVSTVMIALAFFDYGRNVQNAERLLRVQLPPELDPERVLTPVMQTLFDSFSIVLLESVKQGLMIEVLYSVRPTDGVSPSTVIDAISKVNGNCKVAYSYGMHTDDV